MFQSQLRVDRISNCCLSFTDLPNSFSLITLESTALFRLLAFKVPQKAASFLRTCSFKGNYLDGILIKMFIYIDDVNSKRAACWGGNIAARGFEKILHRINYTL